MPLPPGECEALEWDPAHGRAQPAALASRGHCGILRPVARAAVSVKRGDVVGP